MAEVEIWIAKIEASDLPPTDRRYVPPAPVHQWIPDFPQGIGYWTDDGIPDDLVAGDETYATSCYACIVDDSNIPAIRTHLQSKGKDIVYFKDGDERDIQMVLMIRACRDGYDARADAFFDSIDMTAATIERKRTVKDVLLRAVARGVSAEKAEKIRQRLDLPLVAEG